MYAARSQLGWSTEEFIRSTPRFFQRMIHAMTKFYQKESPQEERQVLQYADEIPVK